jgi:hypothetical protein
LAGCIKKLHFAIARAILIVVLDGGKDVERGTHTELLARAGLYAWMWWAQARQEPGRSYAASTRAPEEQTAKTARTMH